jgi:hypothetical protein
VKRADPLINESHSLERKRGGKKRREEVRDEWRNGGGGWCEGRLEGLVTAVS